MTKRVFSCSSRRHRLPHCLTIACSVFLCFGNYGLLALDKSDARPAIPSGEQLYSRLTDLAQRLKTVRVFSADRSQERASPDAKSKMLVRWHDLFVDGDQAQLRSYWEYPDSDQPEWWDGWNSSDEPLTAESIESYGGLIFCHRPHGDVTHVEILKPPPSKKLPYTWLYCTYSTFRPLGNFDLPLIGVRRDWNPPDSPNSGSALLVDQLLSSDVHRWSEIERDRTLNVETLKVVIQMSDAPIEFKLEKHDGALQISSVRTVWFTDDEHNFPIRIEDDRRYLYDGKPIPLVRKDEWRFGSVLAASEYKDFGGGIWYPVNGSQSTYAATPNVAAASDSLDDMVEEFLTEGHYQFKTEMFPTLIREWKVLELEKLPENSELWIEPLDGWMINNVDSRVEQIVGKSVEETREFLYGRGPDDPRPNHDNDEIHQCTSDLSTIKHGSSETNLYPITNIVLPISVAVLLVLVLTGSVVSKR